MITIHYACGSADGVRFRHVAADSGPIPPDRLDDVARWPDFSMAATRLDSMMMKIDDCGRPFNRFRGCIHG